MSRDIETEDKEEELERERGRAVAGMKNFLTGRRVKLTFYFGLAT